MPGLASTSLFSDASLVAYWKLEDTSDSKGAYTLTNTNSVAFSAARFNNGADFGTANSTKDLRIASDLGISATGAISVSFWVKVRTAPSSADFWLFDKTITGANGTRLLIEYYDTAGTKKIKIYRNTTSSNVAADVTSDFGTTNYHHIVATYDGTTLSAYLDGSAIGTPVTSNTTAVTGESTGVMLGALKDTPSNYASVILDDIGIFSKQLSATEVTTLYNSPIGDSNFFTMF